MNTVTQTESPVKIDVNPRLHIAALYQDSIGFQVVVKWYGIGKAIDIDDTSGNAIMTAAMLDNTVDETEGYENDPSARISHLYPNEYAQLLTSEVQKEIAQFQWDMTPRANPRARKLFSGRFADTGAGC